MSTLGGGAARLRPAYSLADAYNARANAITPMRLALALLVVYSHSWVTGGFGFDQFFVLNNGQLQFGAVAVISFFGLSGFLLTGSRQTTERLPFARNRFLRIVPAYWTCLVLMVIVVAPLAASLGGTASTPAVAGWALQMGAFTLTPPDVPGIYAGLATPDWPNGPLWTLPVEVCCYIVIWLSPSRFLRPVAVYLWLGFLVWCGAVHGSSLLLHLPLAFFTGMLLWLWRDRVPAGPWWAALLAVITAASIPIGWLGTVGPVTFAALAVWLTTRRSLMWRRDISYGVYIYAWPVQSLLAMAGVAALGFVPYFAVVTLVVVTLATLSALLIEEPALRFRHRRGVRGAITAGAEA
ncbi:MAG: acyltransferase [Chloroflexota bacterium]